MPRPAETSEPELTTAVDLCRPDGRLNRAAVGWSRRPVHRCNLAGPWGRQKRWDYWCVTTDTHLLSVTYAKVDYLGLCSVLFLDYDQGSPVEYGWVIPGGLGFSLPERVAGGDMRCRLPGLQVEILEAPPATRLQVRCRRPGAPSLDATLSVARPPGHETLNVVVPWSDRRFQFTISTSSSSRSTRRGCRSTSWP